MRYLAFAMASMMIVMVSGCGKKRTFISIESTPAQSEVLINNVSYGAAPVKISFHEYSHFDKGRQSVTAVTEGYHPRTEELDSNWYKNKENHTVDPRSGELGYRLHIRLLPIRR